MEMKCFVAREIFDIFNPDGEVDNLSDSARSEKNFLHLHWLSESNESTALKLRWKFYQI